MAVYKYTLNKYFRSWSTWIIIGFSFFFTFFLGGWLPFHYFSPEVASASSDYITLSVALVAGVTSFLSVFTSIFAGFKSAQMFKDEVEDGTFLLLLSKPIPRGQIIFQKWFALQTIMLLFTFVTAGTFMLGLVCFDEGSRVPELAAFGATTLRGHSILIGLIMWSILTLFGLIFSSIALLASTKLSTGTTIGLSIAIGVVIPMTSLISYFTKKQEVYSSNNKSLENAHSQVQTIDLIYRENERKLQDFLDTIISSVPELANIDEVKIKSRDIDQKSSTINLEKQKESFEIGDQIKLLPLEELTDVQSIWSWLKTSFENYYQFATKDKEGLYNVGITSGKDDAYTTAWIGDLNFQVQQIASIASDVSIPSQAQGISEDALAGTMLSSSRYVNLGELSEYSGHADDVDSTYLNDLINLNSIKIQEFRTGMHYLMLLTNNFLLDNFSEENLLKFSTPPTGKPFKYGISWSLFNDINDYIFPKDSKDKEWSAKGRVEANPGDGVQLNIQDIQELVAQLLIVEIDYIINSPIPGGKTYGALTNNMYNNWNAYKGDPTRKDEIENKIDPELLKYQKQSYLIPEIGKMLATSYRDAFNGFCSKNNISDAEDVNLVYYKTMMDYNKKATTPLSDLVLNTGTLLNKSRDLKITIQKIDGYDLDNWNRDRDYDAMFNPLNLYGDELNTYSALVALDKEELLVKMERQDYVNKYALLGFYFGLALLLVPVSYLLIRKQDYR